ncbi:MAG TPA: MlaD family protein [Solirubrobacteraceae bacterium]|nr:MlaD family protein [Solirubrobacteraceae bacterium]
MRRVAISAVLLAMAAAFIIVAAGASNGSANGTYKIQLDNAFGLVTGAQFKVAGVPAGSIEAINLDRKSLHAVVTVSVTRAGFGHFHQSATCESRPQSLIGEYFIDCNPGSSGPVIKPGGTIPVSHTQSTIAADLVQNVMRLPYRQRFSLIVNELGAAAAARSGDLQAALHRAVPALDETDRLLNLLANDSTTLQNLTRDSNTVITALANNSAQVQRFIVEANRTAVATSHQDQNLRQTFARLPGTLEQLRPAMAKLSQTAVANTPVLNNLNTAAGQLNRFFTDLPQFSVSARPAIKSLGKASVTGKTAVIAAKPTITDLNAFAKPTPELANNLSIVLHDLDTQSRAVERDPRSPGGKGFSGIQALLGYVFNQALAINTYGPYGHVLAVDAFFSKECSPYQSAASLAISLAANGPSARQCYSWLGPNQPGVSTTDPSDPSAKIPDPGGAPPGKTGAQTSAQKLTAADVTAAARVAHALTTATQTTPPITASTTAAVASTTPQASTSTSRSSSGPAINLHQTIGQIITGTGTSHAPSAAASAGAGSSPSTPGGSSAQALLNYLLAP